LTFLDSFGAFISSRAMAVCSRIPGFRRPPTANPPKYKAVLIGINYTSPTSGNEQGRRSLQGPVNDAKEIKKILIGGVSAVALPLTSSTPPLAEVFRYKEKDIFLMTDEEANRDTTHWPSEENIVSLCIRIQPYALSCPLLTLINNIPDSGIARSRSRRIKWRCIRILLWASASILPRPF